MNIPLERHAIAELKEWFFQTSIPVNYSEFKTYIPEYFVYKPNQKAIFLLRLLLKKVRKSIIINSKERSEGNVTSKLLFPKIKLIIQKPKQPIWQRIYQP